MLFGCDLSEFQGTVNWDILNTTTNFALIRSCFGTLRKDYQFDNNKAEAHRVQATAGPLGVGYYHYAYPQYNNPEDEANFFANNVLPLSVGDILALDWEEAYSGDHASWCIRFLRQVEARTGVKPLIYLNQSLIRGHDWSLVVNAGYGLWIAEYDGQTTGSIDTPWPVVAMKQWTSSAHLAGITTNVDADTFYGDFVAFAAYGYQEPAAPSPVPTPVPLPPTVPLPTPIPPPVPHPDPIPDPNYGKLNNVLLTQILAILANIWDKLSLIFK